MENDEDALSIRDWLRLAVVGIFLVSTLFLFVRTIDPPWSVRTIYGTIVSSGSTDAPNRVIRHYKTELLTKTDDNRLIGVFSRRMNAPTPGERITIQERSGLLGTLTFVEIGD